MLSVENPPDPSCSGKISHLKTDERASDRRALQEADLLKKKHLGDTVSNNQLPKFSIRDYVFANRSKDICANWPFPKPYLQLCLNHGIKDPLPPFDTPDSVRKRCSSKASLGSDQLGRKCVGEVGSLGRENAIDLRGDSCAPFDPSILGSADEVPFLVQEQQKVTVSKEVDLYQPETGLDQCEDGNSPSKVKSHAQLGSESSPTSRFPFSDPEANTLPEDSVELEVAEPSCTSPKPGIATEPKGKKCRLIVKLGSISNFGNTEDHTLSTTTISDSMASKVCPVCKTFSSTSNTTLNAHIDQCLAVESTSKLTVNSKLSKHSVKPRKKRSMVDICASAPRCTLEDLDRRNGSNWAADSSMPSGNVKVRTEGKKQRLFHMSLEDNDNEEDGAVYFDSNGTKLRILSKFKDPPSSTVGEDFRHRKHMKDGKDTKNFSTVKRRHLAPRHSKFPKLKPQTESLPQNPDRAEICEAAGGNYGMEASLKKKQSLSELLKVHDRIKPSESGAVGRWVCSKRTGLSKKFCGQGGSHIPHCSSLAPMDPLNETDQSNLSNSSMERSHIQLLPNSSEDPISSLKSKKVGSLLYGAPDIVNRKKSSKLRAGDLSQLSKGSTSSKLDGCVLKLSRSSRKHAASSRSMGDEFHAGPVKSSDGLPKMTSKSSRTCHLLSEKGKNSTWRKRMLLVGPASPISRVNDNESHFILKKSRMHRSVAKTVDQVKTLPSNLDEEYDQGHNFSEHQSGCVSQMEETHKLDCSSNVFETETGVITDRATLAKVKALESGEGRLVVIASEREKSIAFGNLHSVPNCCGLNLAATADSQVKRGCCCCRENAPDMFAGQEPGTEGTCICEKDTVIKLSLEKAVRSSTISSSRNFSSEPHEFSNYSDIWTNNFPSNEKHRRLICGTKTHGPTELCFDDDPEMDWGDKVGSCNIGKNTHSGSDVGPKVIVENVENSLSEVDVIPIPGPPGSFLPSPGGSEVLQESSSLTSNRVLSSQDMYVLTDRDSSGSPVSATSAISHPPMEGTDVKHLEQELVARSAIQDRVSNMSYHSTKPIVRDTATFSRMMSVDEAERTNFGRENVKFTVISPSKGSLEYSADQTCCCSRKEGASWGSVLMHEESNFPGQPATIPAKVKHLSRNQSTRPEVLASSSICPSSKNIDEMMPPILELPKSSIAMKNSHAASVNFPGPSDSYSATPSSHVHPQTTTHPVLRLMGKNLTVVNKDEDASIKLGEFMPGAPSGSPNANYLTLLGYSNVNVPNEDCVSIYRAARKGTVCYDVGLPNGFKNLGNSETHQKVILPQGVNFSNMHIGGSAGSSSQHRVLPQEKWLNSQPSPPFTHVDRVGSSPHLQHRGVVPATEAISSPIQEVIIIDGSPENDADSRMCNAKNSENLRGSQPSPVGMPTSTAPTSHLGQVSPFPCFQSRNDHMQREPPVRTKPSFHVSCPGGVDAIPVKWKGNFEGSGALLQGPVFAPQARRVV
ncbi:uncharacterized protein LOC122073660 [Macadamia integrifolia]|uniref:uncharacterized protein LOC122073660 n=1 Tax=Macadamia integrifolia TaxID=60698 RepID=UPI001C4E3DB8|nr:uncharacterized protein LOC122073660 [Macadamia integrifolia]XP_042494219.1 uncharacterized protein LOC122073660 [Macadamia integrifolia]XP_042494220.1 uncharacterized protein LOC122073660 [Macadamia integrifolia]